MNIPEKNIWKYSFYVEREIYVGYVRSWEDDKIKSGNKDKSQERLQKEA